MVVSGSLFRSESVSPPSLLRGTMGSVPTYSLLVQSKALEVKTIDPYSGDNTTVISDVHLELLGGGHIVICLSEEEGPPVYPPPDDLSFLKVTVGHHTPV